MRARAISCDSASTKFCLSRPPHTPPFTRPWPSRQPRARALDQCDPAPRASRKGSRLTNAGGRAAARGSFLSRRSFCSRNGRAQFGEAAALELCRWNNRPPPIYARINQLRTTVREISRAISGQFSSSRRARTSSACPIRRRRCANGRLLHAGPKHGDRLRTLAPCSGRERARRLRRAGRQRRYLAEMMQNEGTVVLVDPQTEIAPGTTARKSR